MNCCFVILINLILVFALNFDTYVLCIWTNETIQHRKLNRVNRILSNVKPDTSNDKKKETKSSNDSPKNYKGKKSHKKKGSSNDHIEMENSELKPSIECENKYTDDLLNESNGSGDFLHSVKDVAVKKNQCHSYIFNCFAKSRNDNDDDDEDSYKQKYTSENNLDIKSGDDPDEGHSKFWRIKKGSKRGSDTNPFKLDMNYLTRKKSSLPNYEFNLAMVTKFIDSNQKIIDLENENDTVIKDNMNRNSNTVRSRDLLLTREFLQKEYALKKVYEVLPVDFELDRKELIEQIHDSTSGEKDIYEFSYKIFDPICSFLHAYNCFNLNYISNKLINNLRIKKSNAVITKELSKLTEYVQTTHFDIIEYLKDLTYYITNLFEYGHKENLYNELVIFYYSLFFDYYLDTLGKLLYITQIHLKYPFNEQIKNDLSTINARIKTHRDFVENEMIRFYHKYNISENLLECVTDLEKKNVKYDEALDILTHHASFNIFDSAFFNKKKVI